MDYLTNSQKRGILIVIVAAVALNLGLTAFKGQSKFTTSEKENLPTPVAFSAQQFHAYPQKKPVLIDINIADTTAWEQLPGIGKVLSKRIIKYREMIGGFISVEQIQKVYGLKPETYQKILPYLQIDSATIPQQANHKFPNKGVMTQPAEFSVIDINTASEEDWATLPGIGEVLSKRLVKYREAKKGFNDIEEVAKLYGLSPETFEKIKPYLKMSKYPHQTLDKGEYLAKNETNFSQENKFPNKPATFPEKSAAGPKAPVSPIDINQADSAQLFELPGIGEKLAGKIVKYRNMVGFFPKVEYIKGVYGFSDENFEKALPYLKVNNLPSSKKNFNKISAYDLAKYPLMNKEIANTIINFRKLNGYFTNLEEIKNVQGVSAPQLEMIKAYFTL